MINMQCESCKEPTKFPIGFWDGINNTHGCLYDCKNTDCPTKQKMDASTNESQKQQQMTIETNSNNHIDAKNIETLRRDKHITTYHMAKAIGCDVADYSSYEHQRKPFPVDVYKKCMDYLKSV